MLLPHPRVNSELRSSKPSTLTPTKCWRVSGLRLRVIIRVPKSPNPGIRIARPYPPVGGVAAADTVNVEDDALDPGEIVEGLRVQVKPLGAEQVREIWLLNPPTAAALTFKVVEPPAVTVALGAERLNEKLGPVTAAAGIRLANTLVVLPPVGKLG